MSVISVPNVLRNWETARSTFWAMHILSKFFEFEVLLQICEQFFSTFAVKALPSMCDSFIKSFLGLTIFPVIENNGTCPKLLNKKKKKTERVSDRHYSHSM